MTYAVEFTSPIGTLTLASDGEWLTALHLGPAAELRPAAPRAAAGGPGLPSASYPAAEDVRVLREARLQLEAYFAGTLRQFRLPLRPQGTAFQQRVWAALCAIPYGNTWSYGRIAERIGAPGAARAVGAANGQNPIAIIVPCHRVIGASGKLVGYGGGLPRKSWLLEHEQRVAAAQLTLV